MCTRRWHGEVYSYRPRLSWGKGWLEVSFYFHKPAENQTPSRYFYVLMQSKNCTQQWLLKSHMKLQNRRKLYTYWAATKILLQTDDWAVTELSPFQILAMQITSLQLSKLPYWFQALVLQNTKITQSSVVKGHLD